MKLKIFSIAAYVFLVQTSLAQNVGIGTTTPQARLHVADSNVYFTSPSSPPGAGLTPTENSGYGLLWVADKAALRVGRETGTNWAHSNIGGYSASFGFNNKVTSVGGFAAGSYNIVSGLYGLALGNINNARNDGAVAIGYLSQGLGDYTNAIGCGVRAQSFQSTALGRFNIYSGNSTTDFPGQPIFVVGNGTDDANRSNALTILKNGNVGIGNVAPNYPLDVRTSDAKIGLYVSNEKIIDDANSASIYSYHTNSKGAAIRAFAAEPSGSSVSPRDDFAYGVLAQVGYDRYGVGAFSRNKSAVLAISSLGTAVEAESSNGIALNTKGVVRLTQIGEATGKILVSDATGNATWQNPANITLYQSTGTGKSEVNFRNQGNYVGSFGWSQASTRFFLYDQNTGTNPLVIKGGRVGIGDRDATTNMLEVNGNASKSAAGSWLGNSDARLKKDIQPITSALQKLMQLKGISYQWADNKTGIKRPEGIQMGFTAQNIQEVFPNEVSTDTQGYLQTAYGTYDALLVEAIRELKNENDLLKIEIGEIKRLLEKK